MTNPPRKFGGARSLSSAGLFYSGLSETESPGANGAAARVPR